MYCWLTFCSPKWTLISLPRANFNHLYNYNIKRVFSYFYGTNHLYSKYFWWCTVKCKFAIELVGD